MEKINIAELLKDCPKGMELYSPLCGKCIFDRLNFGTIICKKQNTQEITFTSEGYYMLPVFDNCECMIFPSKDQRDWSKFQRPFKDGDIITCTNSVCSFVAIFKKMNTNTTFRRYVLLTLDDKQQFWAEESWSDFKNPRFATEEERQKLFDAIKDNGYKWDTETKTLEKLYTIFKVGDKIKLKNVYAKKYDDFNTREITEIKHSHYILDDEKAMPLSNQYLYELVPNKFDITTLKPFDKVLVRDTNSMHFWEPKFFFRYEPESEYPFRMLNYQYFNMCIPYEGNEHLIGTTDDCNDFYKTWK